MMMLMLTICWREDEASLDRSWLMSKELPVLTTTICFNWWGGGSWSGGGGVGGEGDLRRGYQVERKRMIFWSKRQRCKVHWPNLCELIVNEQMYSSIILADQFFINSMFIQPAGLNVRKGSFCGSVSMLWCIFSNLLRCKKITNYRNWKNDLKCPIWSFGPKFGWV